MTDVTNAQSYENEPQLGDYYALMKPRVMQLVVFTAVVGMLADLQKNTGDIGTSMKQLRVLFLHTGGLLGMYDKVDQLQKVVDNIK